MSGPSQPKVEDEQWSDERIAGFLTLKPLDDSSADYHVLYQSYQHMTAGFFSRLVKMFVADGRDIHAKSSLGQTILDHASEHKRSEEYVQILKSSGV